jgi:hypothetical protein
MGLSCSNRHQPPTHLTIASFGLTTAGVIGNAVLERIERADAKTSTHVVELDEGR